MKQREKFSSRLGFILISAGCAIGLGNVYRFPITTGAYGGAFFVLIYLAFLLLLGIPVMTTELSVGRASQRSIASSFDVLERPRQKWHWTKFLGIAGNYLLMMFYTAISGWMVIYFWKYASGSIMNLSGAEALGGEFVNTITNSWLGIGVTAGVILVCFFVCSLGLQKGVEKVTKVMMVALLGLMIGLAVYACTLGNATEGLKFYLVPNLDRLKSAGISTVVSSAMGQAFFTLSIGIGSIAIFGSYIGKDRRLTGEAVTITALDTFVALMAGVIIFPACFTFNGGQTADAGTVGAGFLFTTLSSIFNAMKGGRIIGTLFFLFMIFAAFSTVIAVFENIMSFWLELTNLNRKAVAAINIVLMLVLCLPALFSLNGMVDFFATFELFGKTGFMDIEDFIVSNLLLPIGSLIYVLFCTSRFGWGWNNYYNEVNTGKGIKFPKFLRFYMTYIVPSIILAVLMISVIPADKSYRWYACGGAVVLYLLIAIVTRIGKDAPVTEEPEQEAVAEEEPQAVVEEEPQEVIEEATATGILGTAVAAVLNKVKGVKDSVPTKEEAIDFAKKNKKSIALTALCAINVIVILKTGKQIKRARLIRRITRSLK